jgi:ribulose-phosphate 3-epimerase
MTRLAPSILSADFLRLGDEIKAAEDAGADFIHVDVMDGIFVPNITIGPFIVEAARKATGLPLDVHLMIDRPERYIAEFVSAGADYLVVHEETTIHLHNTVQNIKSNGAKPGIALNPTTPISALDHILHDIDMVVIMSVNPGFGGQGFIADAIGKIRALKDAVNERAPGVLIEVDGGVKPENARQVVDAGADVLVMGSAFFGSGDYKALVKKVRENLSDAR